MNTQTQKKATIATVKSFIKKNSGQILIKVSSAFDGMTDGCQYFNNIFQLAKTTNTCTDCTFGIDGAWFVGMSRDYITRFENDNLIGFEISNSCGHFSLAISKN